MVGELCGGNETTVPSLIGDHSDWLFIDYNEVAWAPSFQTVLSVAFHTDARIEEKGFVAEYFSCELSYLIKRVPLIPKLHDAEKNHL